MIDSAGASMQGTTGNHLTLDAANVVWRSSDAEVIALDRRSSTYLTVNASGRLLWDMLSLGTTRPELTSKLVDAFGLDEQRAEHDVDAFLAHLSELGLLHSRAPGSPA